mgnify:CR=1 FL=1
MTSQRCDLWAIDRECFNRYLHSTKSLEELVKSQHRSKIIFKKSIKDMKRSNLTILDKLKDKSASAAPNKVNPNQGVTQKFNGILDEISL